MCQSVYYNSLYSLITLPVLFLETQALADEAAEKVIISYSDCKPPIITVKDAIIASSFFPGKDENLLVGDPDGKVLLSCAPYNL